MPLPTILNPVQRRLYEAHGHVLAAYPVTVVQLAKQLGVSRYDLLVVEAYVKANGTPVVTRKTGATHLVIGDAHAKPNQSLARFRWLGRVVEELGQKALSEGTEFKVIQIGDWFDMPSLSSYDKGRGSAELRRYKADIEAGHDAYALVAAEISSEVRAVTDFHAIGGNHGEGRCKRFMNDNPELIGLLHGPRETSEAFGWHYTPYLEWLHLDGVGYCHYMQNPNSGTAVSGVNVGRSLLIKGHRSVTVGHNHRLDSYTSSDAFGAAIQTLSCGCYFEEREAYAGQSNDKWWRGLCVKTDVRDGQYNLQTLTFDSIRRKYATLGEE